MRKAALSLFILLVTLVALPAAAGDEETLLLRFPDVHENKIAFVYAGDIWTVGTDGGTARRLTSHEGQEVFPKFSPDGNWIAFSGEYGGNRQVFVIPTEGGTPRQLTWYNDVGPMPPRGGFDYRVLGWTPDGRDVIFRANRLPWGVRMGRPYSVPVAGGLEKPLPIPEGGGGDLSPDGRVMAYTPIDREFRTWKRYNGGRAQDVWLYEMGSNRSIQITDAPGTDNQPVWVGGYVYFTSDRAPDRKLNLWRYDPATRETVQITEHDEFDVLWPSGGARHVVYENGGALWLFDPATDESRQVPVRVYGDLPYTVPRIVNVRDRVEWFEISPSGKRALFAARGDVFTAPAKDGEVHNVTRSQGVREISPVWSPDGRRIAYMSDRDGEYDIYFRDDSGAGDEQRVLTGGDVWRYALVWSPDSTRLAWGDTKQRLRYVDVDSGKVVDVDRAEHNDITTYVWSPDSKWLAYTKLAENQLSVIWAYSLDDRESMALTDELTGNFGPVFDPNGKYFYFLSNRDFNLTFSGWEFNYLYTAPTRVYLATLNDDIPLPFQPKSDEEEPKEDDGNGEEDNGDDNGDDGGDKKNNDGENDGGGKAKGKSKSKKEDDKALRIQVDGFTNRVAALPGVASGNYGNLTATKAGVLYTRTVNGRTGLHFFDMKTEKEKTVLEGINGYALSRNEKKILYAAAGNNYGIVDNKPGQKASDGRLDLAGMEMRIEPREEWKQMYTDAWRILRDWFYDPEMHGVNWKRIHDRYARLVPHVAHRADLDYILGEVGGELNAGHIYVQSGDQPAVTRRNGGLLGAELEPDRSGYYRVVKIFPGENWHPNFRSPLTEPGVNVRVGDLILAIDGREVTTRDNPYRFLENTAGRVVTLTVNDRPDMDSARREKVRPVAQETNLRYLDWVLERRRRVEEASGGRIGYIHMPNTAQPGNRELFKYFYPQANKDALILDVRYNGGGFIPDRMIELLDRPVLNYWARRGLQPTPTPAFAHRGPKVCLINGYSSSGGDAFPYYFRKRGLGPLIGTRTWGGLIGISGNPMLVDGGGVLASTFRFMDTEGEWAVENVGVAPDIEVYDRPELVHAGRDPVLEKAVEVLLEELEKGAPATIEWPRPWKDPVW